MNRLEKYDIIKQVIDSWDPVFLHDIGCPSDEYSIEITKISSKIESLNNSKDLGLHIYTVFLEMFGESTDTKARNLLECQKIAKKILDKINIRNV